MNINRLSPHKVGSSWLIGEGIDKLTFTTRELELVDTEGWEFTDGWQRLGEEPPPLPFIRGKEVRKRKGKCNTDLANFTLNSQGLHIVFNPSTVFHDFQLATEEQTWDALHVLETECQNVGLELSFWDMKTTRTDYARDILPDQPLSMYRFIWKGLQGRRMKDKREYPTGFQIGNEQQQLVSYDKNRAVFEKHGYVPDRDDVMRTEYRALKTRSVPRVYGFSRLKDLPSYAELKLKYVQNVQALFKGNTVTPDMKGHHLDEVQSVDLMMKLLSNGERDPVGKFYHVMTNGAMPPVDMFRSWWKKAGATDKQVENFRRRYLKIVETVRAYPGVHQTRVKMVDMYNEILYKLTA